MKRVCIIFLMACLYVIQPGCKRQMTMPFMIWISPVGNDHNPGTEGHPVASLNTALRKVRELRRLNDPSIQAGAEILLHEGTYYLDEPLFIRPEDSGKKSSPTIIKPIPGARPVISGGIQIMNWVPADLPVKGLPAEAQGKIWMADIPEIWGKILDFRQLWINGQKAVRAGNLDNQPLDRILSVDKEQEEIWIPLPDNPLPDPSHLEFIIHQWWAIANLRIKSMDIMGDKARLRFHQPESRLEFEHPWPAPFIDTSNEYNGNSAFYLANAIEFLDRPGEWFRDPVAGKIYYYPRENEDMRSAEVLVPVREQLLQIEGNREYPVRYITLKGLEFKYTSWIRPSERGHVPLQEGMYLLDAYKLDIPGTPDKSSLENQAWTGRQPAAVTLRHASHISIEECSFMHMAATGLDLVAGTRYNRIEGCVFRDIGGTAIQGGFFGNRAHEAHIPYNPDDHREICHDENITNNYITDCTNEDWGCAGISVGYARDINIEHNELSYLNYSGICVGWGWTGTISCLKNNRVHANHIHHFARQMYDVGGIYTLSAQPGTEISNNCIHDLEKAPYAHLPEHYQYIYLDEGSSYISITDNWTEQDRFFSNTPGPGNKWINNGPDVSDAIRQAAGLQPEYRYLLNK